jgi:hypothetical protein
MDAGRARDRGRGDEQLHDEGVRRPGDPGPPAFQQPQVC